MKETEELPPGGLDLYIAEEDEFSPDKLRSTIERFYMTVFIGLAGFVKHIARLRSWNERTRTTWFCCVHLVPHLTNIAGIFRRMGTRPAHANPPSDHNCPHYLPAFS